MAQKQSHTAIRNGKLFCSNCGSEYDMQLPQPMNFVSLLMNAFDKAHSGCAKTWHEPLQKEEMSEKECEHWWIVNGEHGLSSKAMFSALRTPYSPAFPSDRNAYPHDPDDFRRCYLLLKACPHFKQRLYQMKEKGKVWSNLVDHWDQLTEMMENAIASKSKIAKGMYELMRSLGC